MAGKSFPRRNRLPPDDYGCQDRASFDLVVPLAHEATAMRTTDTADRVISTSGAVSPSRIRRGDVDSTMAPSTGRTTATRTCRTSTTATRTTTTSRTSTTSVSSAHQSDAVISLAQLLRAHYICRRNKRNTIAAIEFERDLEANIIGLHEKLIDRSYRPGRSICFTIKRPKDREVFAAGYPDRVVHHALYNEVADRFERRFSANTFACIKGRGTLAGVNRLDHYVRSVTENWKHPAYYLKCDIDSFFVSIDKNIVFDMLAELIHEPWWLWLAETILFHDPREDVEIRSTPDELALIPPHKTLFNKPPHIGLPIGNLPSQFCANVIMNPVDQLCHHRFPEAYYVRYVDDFVLLHRSAQYLNEALAQISDYLQRVLNLRLNPHKTILQPIPRGVDFVGQVIKPWHRTTRRRTVNEAVSRISAMDAEAAFKAGNSYLGLIRQATASHTDQSRIAKQLLRKGLPVNQKLTKVYP